MAATRWPLSMAAGQARPRTMFVYVYMYIEVCRKTKRICIRVINQNYSKSRKRYYHVCIQYEFCLWLWLTSTETMQSTSISFPLQMKGPHPVRASPAHILIHLLSFTFNVWAPRFFWLRLPPAFFHASSWNCWACIIIIPRFQNGFLSKAGGQPLWWPVHRVHGGAKTEIEGANMPEHESHGAWGWLIDGSWIVG